MGPGLKDSKVASRRARIRTDIVAFSKVVRQGFFDWRKQVEALVDLQLGGGWWTSS